MNVIEFENKDKKYGESARLGMRIWFFADSVWYAPACGVLDLKMPYKYTREDYLNGIMEWA